MQLPILIVCVALIFPVNKSLDWSVEKATGHQFLHTDELQFKTAGWIILSGAIGNLNASILRSCCWVLSTVWWLHVGQWQHQRLHAFFGKRWCAFRSKFRSIGQRSQKIICISIEYHHQRLCIFDWRRNLLIHLDCHAKLEILNKSSRSSLVKKVKWFINWDGWSI